MSFNRTVLPDTLIFDYNPRIPQIDFSEGDFPDGKVCYISLFKSDIPKLHLDYIHFKLIWMNYARAPLTTEDKETVYEALLKNFKDNGQTESYKRLDIEYANFKWEQQNLKLLSLISKWWWNYGYSRWLIFAWAFGFVFVFSLVNFFFLDYLTNWVYPMSGIPIFSKTTRRSFSWLANLQKFWYSFVYTSMIFFRLTLKIDQLKFNKVFGVLYILLIYTIGLICLAYMANFVLKK